ncbi:queuosine precursor transporter [Neobacillus sp. MM2021_6]|uniref:queuosine precursor transporter n=1 Tax=Bacillaceae TaxID=186817 RepID=UPI00140C524B|nr:MULTISPECIES: queuosine precursor transporter [Bacillaceae]MBO0962721.1 queuosine precursor transporter [Neobacillus sp. MM2021_6]NHC20378.1 queuosine precursor transporter [Bacillus sp. MM2020_4]
MIFYLNGIFVGLLILANIVAVKLFSIGDFAMLPAAVIVYIFTYPLIDVIVEVYGKKEGRRAVQAGLITQILALIFITITIHLPAAPVFQDQKSFETILNGSFRVIIASLISYAVSQNLDVFVFNKLKGMHGQKKLWLRNNASTMLSQLIDTTIFITIAFYGTMPIAILGSLILTQYIFKFGAAILTTPLVYGLVHMIRKQETKESAAPLPKQA